MRLLTTALVVSLVTVTGAQVDPAPAFEVVSVRLNQSNPPMQVLPTLQQGGRVFAINLPLREFIRVAYGLQDNQLVLDSKMADMRFDLEARAGVSANSKQAVMMLRRTLADRFGLKTHAETRELPVYSLVRADNSRLGAGMKPSGPECAPLTFPSSAPGGPPAPPPPPPPPPALAGTPLVAGGLAARCPTVFFPGGLSARSMDMAAFAFALERIVRRPVVDKTGLTGVFDIDMRFTPDSLDDPFLPRTGGGPNAGPAGPVSADPSLPSLFTALRDQLGLRLEGSRASVDVLVVDDVRQPTEN